MSDGSTDSSVTEQEIIYMRYCRQGVVSVKFVSLQAVHKGSAVNIKAAVDNGMGSLYGKWKSKIVAFGSDGAAVMTGKKGGVIALLRKECPWLQGVHCMGHRCELSFKDAVRTVPIHKRLDEFLVGIYYFFHNSPLNRGNLRESGKVLQMNVWMPTRIGGTRWLAHMLRALTSVLSGYPVLLEYFGQTQSELHSSSVRSDTKNKAKYFYRCLLSLDLMTYAHYMADVLLLLSRFSLQLQSPTAMVGEIRDSLEAKLVVLARYKTESGAKLKAFEESDKSHLKGTSVAFDSGRQKVLDGLMASLQHRFEDLSEGVMVASEIADFKSWPPKDQLKDFGEAHIVTLIGEFKVVLEEAGVKIDAIPEEWIEIRQRVYARTEFKELKSLTWEQLNQKFGHLYPNFLAVVDLLLSIPVGSTDCERGFNRMKMIKTDQRTRLSNEALSDQLTILLSSADVNTFDPLPAIDLWKEAATRRLGVTVGQEDREEEQEQEDLLESLERGRDKLEAIAAKLADITLGGLPKGYIPRKPVDDWDGVWEDDADI